MLQKDKRRHYYYVTKKHEIEVIKAFNKKQLHVQGYLDTDIITRQRHFADAMAFAKAYSGYLNYTKPYYRTLTGNDVVD